MTPRSLFRRDPEGGAMRLFAGRRAFWSFNTRVAIRAGCDILGLRPGDEILAPAYNCGSEVDPLIDAGLTVRLYPVGEDLRADPERIAPLITEATRALYVTHYFGLLQPDMAALRKLCDKRGLRMIEDCALSLLSGARPAEGRTGDVSVFCFHKFMPALEGGALVLNADDLEAEEPFPNPPPRRTVLRKSLRALLAGALGPARFQSAMRRVRGAPAEVAPSGAVGAAPSGADGLDDIPGHYYFNPSLRGARMSRVTERALRGFSAAKAISARRENWRRYRTLLDDVPGIRLLTPELAPETCPLNMPVIVAERDRVARALQARGIAATPWWAGFNRNLDWSGQAEAMALKNSVLGLPLHPPLRRAHLRHIVSALREVL